MKTPTLNNPSRDIPLMSVEALMKAAGEAHERGVVHLRNGRKESANVSFRNADELYSQASLKRIRSGQGI